MRRPLVLLAALIGLSMADVLYVVNVSDSTIRTGSPVGMDGQAVTAVAKQVIGDTTIYATVADKLYNGNLGSVNQLNRAQWRLSLHFYSAASPDTLLRRFKFVWRDDQNTQRRTWVYLDSAYDTVLTFLPCKLESLQVVGRDPTDSVSVQGLPTRGCRAITSATAGTYPYLAVAQAAIPTRQRGRAMQQGEGWVKVDTFAYSGYSLTLSSTVGKSHPQSAMPDTGWLIGTALQYAKTGDTTWSSISRLLPGNARLGTNPPGTTINWYGDSADWPSGYRLCNGTNYYLTSVTESTLTPNMLNRFAVGANGDSSGYPTSTISGTEHSTGGTIQFTPDGTVGTIDTTLVGGINAATGGAAPAYASHNHTHPAPTFTGVTDSIIPPYVAFWPLIRSWP